MAKEETDPYKIEQIRLNALLGPDVPYRKLGHGSGESHADWKFFEGREARDKAREQADG